MTVSIISQDYDELKGHLVIFQPAKIGLFSHVFVARGTTIFELSSVLNETAAAVRRAAM